MYPARDAAFMADSQVPWGVEALNGDGHRAGVAQQAELVPGHDRGPDDPAAGPADDGRARRSHHVEQAGSHAIYVSQPAGRRRTDQERRTELALIVVGEQDANALPAIHPTDHKVTKDLVGVRQHPASNLDPRLI